MNYYGNQVYNQNDMQHYGVLGMKWGVRRSLHKSQSNARLEKRALNLDKRSAKMTKKSEKVHSDLDLGRANKAAKKMAKYRIKAAKARLRLANNQRYIAMTKRKVSDMQTDPKYAATVAELRNRYSSVLG